MPAHPPYHTRAAVVSTGDELVIGQMLDTNSKWIADRLMSVGIEVVEHVTIGDDRAATVATLRRLSAAVPLVLTTGGLGPTPDDVMREALAEVMGDALVLDERSLGRLEARFAARGRPMTENQRLQAMRPARAECLDNGNGTAPGLHTAVAATSAGAAAESADVFCLPGPPAELRVMFEREVLPRLRLDPARVVATRLLHVIGLAEGEAAARLGDLLERGRNPLMGITASSGVLTLRIRGVGEGERSELERRIDAVEGAARERLGVHVFGAGDETLASAIVEGLRRQRGELAVVESCTGGLLGQLITEVSGASAVFRGGWITYSNDLKVELVGVPETTLAAHGAVSAETARAMVVGGLRRGWPSGAVAASPPDTTATSSAATAGPRHCVSITGIAGPEGGTPEKPVGLVFIAHARQDLSGARSLEVRRFQIPGGRDEVRQRAARAALAMLYFGLVEAARGGPALLWEVGRWTEP